MPVFVQCEHLHTILYKPISFCIGPGVGQCEHTITHIQVKHYSILRRILASNWCFVSELIVELEIFL